MCHNVFFTAGLFYVDAAQRANHGSSCSHSCNANCQSAVVARNGKLVIVLTTVKEQYSHSRRFMKWIVAAGSPSSLRGGTDDGLQ
jgi:hypothetical protein